MRKMKADETPATYNKSTLFLPDSSVEIIRELALPSPPEHALIDFDGTISLIREGWTGVMSSFMVENLRSAGTDEPDDVLYETVSTFITELTGKQTIYQMICLSEEMKKRGAVPKEPLAYKHEYNRRLLKHIRGRCDSLRSGKVQPKDMTVPFALEFLSALRERGMTLYLASGTDIGYVREEAQLLGLEQFFGDNIYGALDDYRSFSKKKVIDQILCENNLEGTKLIGFGDGYVEIENVKSAGGTAVGVASDEAVKSGIPDPWKRDRLIGIGADVIIPDYRDFAVLLDYIWKNTTVI